MMTKLEFMEKYSGEIRTKYKIEPEFLFDEYKDKVHPYLSLITSFKLENKLLQDYCAMELMVDKRLFGIMRKYFSELDEAWTGKKEVMQFKANLDLQKALLEKPTSGKLNEIQMVRWDEEYKKKDEGSRIEDVNVNFNIVDASKPNED